MKQKEPPLIKRLLGGTAIVGALYMVLFSGIPHFSNEDAERILSELSAHLAEEAAHRGKEAHLQYSSIDIHGFAYDKWARVLKPSLDLIYPQWYGGSRMSISTASTDLLPDPSNSDRLLIRLTETLNIISGSELLAQLTPSKPIAYSINRKPTDAPDAIKHRMVVPADVRITTIAPKRDFLVELARPLMLEVALFRLQHRLNARILANSIKTNLAHFTAGADGIEMRYDSVQKGASVIESKGTVSLDKLTFTHGALSSPAYVATAAWTMKEQRNISGATDAASLLIEHSILTDGNSKITANGTVNFDLDDAAYGEIILEISNPEELLKSTLIAPEKYELARALLDDVMEDDIRSHKQAIIPITREKNGQWNVGKVPLDTLIEKGLLDIFIFSKDIKKEYEPHEKDSKETSATPAS